MSIVVIILLLILATLAMAGWWRAWQLGRRPSFHHRPPADHETSVSAAQEHATEEIARSIEHATELFQKNLTVQALKVNDTLEGLAKQQLRKQVEDFTAAMDGLTGTATTSVAQLEALIDTRRQALEASMSTEVVEEKQRAVERLYNHLSDLVAAYIVDTLGSDIDLAGQLPFVLKVLEQNKAAIREDVLREH